MEIGFTGPETISLARLERVESSLRFSTMSDVTAISLPSLESVGNGAGSAMDLLSLPSLVELRVPALRRVDGDLSVEGAPLLGDGVRSALGRVEVTGARTVQH